MLPSAAAQKNDTPPRDEESAFSPAFYEPYAAAVQSLFLLCCALRDAMRMAGENPGVREMTYRLKTPASIGGKLLGKGLPVSAASAGSALHDVAGLRVVLDTTAQVYRFARMLASAPDVQLLSTRDYIKNPKPSGYRSLHLLVRVPVSVGGKQLLVPAEIQLRTVRMDIWASIEHDVIYKPVK